MATPIEKMLNDVDWEILPPMEPGELPHATHSGVLTIGEYKLRCYRLSNGLAVFDADDFEGFLGVLTP